jgi:hypothetical protein
VRIRVLDELRATICRLNRREARRSASVGA